MQKENFTSSLEYLALPFRPITSYISQEMPQRLATNHVIDTAYFTLKQYSKIQLFNMTKAYSNDNLMEEAVKSSFIANL